MCTHLHELASGSKHPQSERTVSHGHFVSMSKERDDEQVMSSRIAQNMMTK
jgi:hypothetical protein